MTCRREYAYLATNAASLLLARCNLKHEVMRRRSSRSLDVLAPCQALLIQVEEVVRGWHGIRRDFQHLRLYLRIAAAQSSAEQEELANQLGVTQRDLLHLGAPDREAEQIDLGPALGTLKAQSKNSIDCGIERPLLRLAPASSGG